MLLWCGTDVGSLCGCVAPEGVAGAVSGSEEGKFWESLHPSIAQQCLQEELPGQTCSPGSSGRGQQGQAQEETSVPLSLLPFRHPECLLNAEL